MSEQIEMTGIKKLQSMTMEGWCEAARRYDKLTRKDRGSLYEWLTGETLDGAPEWVAELAQQLALLAFMETGLRRKLAQTTPHGDECECIDCDICRYGEG